MKLITYIVVLIVIFSIGFSFGEKKFDTDFLNSTPQEKREGNTKNFEFINPLLECGELSNLKLSATKEMERLTKNYISVKKNLGKIQSASVYFRQLKSGPWFGVDEKEYFFPASLLKVPLMFAVYKKAEEDPAFLQTQVSIDEEEKIFPQIIKPSEEIDAKKQYSALELLRYSIVFSDNRATLKLYELVGTEKLNEVFQDLGIETPAGKDEFTVQVRTYGSFFRILYNASYLTRKYSEDALRLLSESDFREGLHSGVPKNIKIAHKFGERESRGMIQLHDCGIVFYPSSPYVLCVMTRGEDILELKKIIGEISKIVFENIERQ